MSEDMVTAIGTDLILRDYAGMIKMRFGIGRNKYRVNPGLYKMGAPENSSPVFVSANYKMSFDLLRKELSDMNAWILVLNTRGVNVWCAAGKKTFSTSEIIRMLKISELVKFISHRELILPQLSAPGVSAHEVAKETGFKVRFGPIRAKDIRRFMDEGKKADKDMRMVTFNIWERVVLTPNEITPRTFISFCIIVAIFVVSGIGNAPFSIQTMLGRGLFGTTAYIVGLFAGAFVTPILLPWIPGRSFSLKGALAGLVLSSLFCLFLREPFWSLDTAAVLIFATTVSSYVALTFTGSTPFTSPTGVEKEMRHAIPIQIAMLILSCGLWIAGGFIGGRQ